MSFLGVETRTGVGGCVGGGEIFVREGDIILSDTDLINLSYQFYNGCKNFIFIDFKFIRPISYEESTMGCVLSKEKVIICSKKIMN